MQLALVVQRGVGHGDPTDKYGVEHGIWSDRTGSTYVDADLLQRGCLLLRWQLVGHRPPRALGSKPELLLLGQIIDFHHHAIDLGVVLVTTGQGVGYVGFNTREIGNTLTGRVDP